MQERVELAPPLPQVEQEAGQVHQHVDRDDDGHVDGGHQDERYREWPVLRAEPEGQEHPHHELGEDRYVGRLPPRVDVGESPGKDQSDPGHGIPRPGGGVGGGIRIGDGRIGDGQEHQHPPRAPHLPRQEVPGVAAAHAGEPGELGRAEVHHGCVRGQDVEEADPDARVHHRELDVAARVDRFFCQRSGRLESDECEDRVDRPRHDSREPGEPLHRCELRPEHAEVVGAAGLDDQPDGQGREHTDLEETDQRSGPRAELDAEVSEDEHHDGRGQRRDPPPLAVAPPELLVQDRRHEVAEDQIEQRCHQRLDPRISPRHQEAHRGVDAPGRVGVEAACRREVLGQLSDRDGHEQTSDQRQDDRERKRAAREPSAGDDRERNGGRRRHVGDRLEQDLSQPDGLTSEAGGGGASLHL